MILKRNNGQKKALNTRKKGIQKGIHASPPHAPPPSPRYATESLLMTFALNLKWKPYREILTRMFVSDLRNKKQSLIYTF